MATNPLFSCFKGKKFSYTPQIGKPRQNSVNLTRYSNGMDDKPPPSKKQRMANDQFWDDDDDDFELTQKELESLDSEVMAHTAQNGNKPQPATRHTYPGPSGAARLPSHVTKYSSAPGRMPGQSSSFIKPRPVHQTSSSESPNPQSLSSGSASRNSSVSTSSEEIPLAPVSRRSSTSFTDSKDHSLATAFLRDPVVEGEIERYKQQCAALKEEMLSKDGRIKILQCNLTKKDTELGELRQERARHLDQQKKEYTEKEKNLQSQLDKLTTQLQFKDREIDNFRERCHNLEMAARPATASQRSPRISSPVVKRKKSEEKSPKVKTLFPTSQSFMAADISMQPSTSTGIRRPVETKDEGTMASLQSSDREQTERTRQFGLKLRTCTKGNVSSVELLADLLDADLTTDVSGEERGIVGLLQMQTSVVDLQSLQFDRDSSSLLSPIPNKRLLELKRQESTSLSSPAKTTRKSIVTSDSYTSAIHGMKCLLSNQKTFQSRTESNVISSDTELNGAILFIPMINDYLTQYMDMLSSNLETRTCLSPRGSLTSSASPKSSYSSIESLTSSLDMLLKDSANYANNLESMTLVTLQVLYKLVSFSSVIRDILLNVESGSRPLQESSTDEGERPMETDESSPASTISKDSDWSVTSQKMIDLGILRKVIKIADCGQKEKWYNVQVIEKCFDILVVLANHATVAQIESLKPVHTGRIIMHALECRTEKQMVICALKLLSTLVQYNTVVSSLCVCQEGCILMTIYQTCTDLIETESDDALLIIGQLVIETLNSIQSIHKGGIVLLLESASCSCNGGKVIPPVVLLVCKLLKIYENRLDKAIIPTLTKGLLLLHVMYQKYEEFSDKHYPVEHQYVKLVCGLTKILKEFPKEYEQELAALEELWDYYRDDSELSQDNDEENQSGSSEDAPSGSNS